jgi:hypothetical protein
MLTRVTNNKGKSKKEEREDFGFAIHKTKRYHFNQL